MRFVLLKAKARLAGARFFAAVLLVLFLGLSTTLAYFYQSAPILKRWFGQEQAIVANTEKIESKIVEPPHIAESAPPSAPEREEPKETVPVPSAPSQEAREQIAVEPPKQDTPAVASTTDNADGSQTTIVAEGSVSQEEFRRLADSSSSPATPLAVVIEDETGANSSLIEPLKNYLNSVLRWGSEISALKKIILRDAGDLGWSGQYAGSYTISSSGTITAAAGYIILNIYYKKDSEHLLDYMKVTLAHEYGHHYTLYHKWKDLNLPAGVRFPDAYYSTRPLSKETITTDCSNSWSTCESEIIAEDYSFLYSGYGTHAMQASLGLPSDPGTRDWLNNLASTSPQTPPPPPNNPPTISLISPRESDTLADKFNFEVAASDDKAVSKVDFYRNDELLAEKTTAPYLIPVDLSNLSAGSYIFKAKAYDADDASADLSFTLTLRRIPAAANSNQREQNEITNNSDQSAEADITPPTIAFLNPTSSPYQWGEGHLTLKISAADNTAVVKIELYINDNLVVLENSDTLIRRWQKASAGDYNLVAKAYDAAGNVAEAVLEVVKQ